MNDAIAKIRAREVLDSRGNPTVEVDIVCHGGWTGRAIVPSGASTGKHEALELRDGDPARYGGKGVRRAVANVHDIIAPSLAGMSVLDQEAVDCRLLALDGTADKSQLGANAILGVSLACAHTAAAVQELSLWKYLATRDEAAAYAPSLPLPMVNLISGGLHAGRNLEFQDFLLLPIGAESYSQALAMAVAVYRALSATLIESGHEGVLVGDEGGFGPRLTSNARAVELILKAITRAGLTPGRDAALALDVAATHFYRDGCYYLEKRPLSSEQLAEFLVGWVEAYPILSIEDGMAEDDWAGWQALTQALGQRVQLIGDDLFVTNPRRLEQGIGEKVANSILIKVNQIGTLTETLNVLSLARSAGYRPVISARSGETEDSTIADLAVGTGAGQIKIGSIVRGERLAKYNQLLRIEADLGGEEAPFARWANMSAK